MTQHKFLFLGGSARSGTSALTNLVNANKRAIIGMERYINLWQKKVVTPAHFEMERFMDVQPGDMPGGNAAYVKNMRFETRFGKELVVGDKFPLIHAIYGHVRQTFDNYQILYILREPLSVCESYQAFFETPGSNFKADGMKGLSLWNAGVRATRDVLAQGSAPIVVVEYEKIFSSRDAAAELYEKLGLSTEDVSWAVVDKIIARALVEKDKQLPRRQELRKAVAAEADFEAYRDLLRYSA